jgi:hypothetical protein
MVLPMNALRDIPVMMRRSPEWRAIFRSAGELANGNRDEAARISAAPANRGEEVLLPAMARSRA